MSNRAEAAPSDLKARGGAFWRTVTGQYDGLRADERELLAESCRMLDGLDALRGLVEQDGWMVTDDRGRVTLHPAVAEQRQVRQALRLALRQLGLPDADGESDATKGARAAANVRWGTAS